MFLPSRVETSVAPLQHGEFPSSGLKTIAVGCFVKHQRVNKSPAGDFFDCEELFCSLYRGPRALSALIDGRKEKRE